ENARGLKNASGGEEPDNSSPIAGDRTNRKRIGFLKSVFEGCARSNFSVGKLDFGDAKKRVGTPGYDCGSSPLRHLS
ncbi:MAG TPA: hypothetical protein VJL56_00060, partial [Candidatus Bathyarchaeia archaeon]|nr:hypothetical protein [Candidatus Bathyarchaeia archaeon]